MPLSIWQGMEDCLGTIVERRPSAVLDAGIGFGLWGHLLRQYLDVWSGRIQREQWITRIDGIEIDPERVQAHSRHLYTNIYIGDIREEVPRRASETAYDVILFGDVLEHLSKNEARQLLDTACGLATELVVVRIPLGDGWRREGRAPPDHHRSRWYADDFDAYRAAVRLYEFWGNPYALVAIESGAMRRGAALADLDRKLAYVEDRLAALAGVGAPRLGGVQPCRGALP